MSLPPRPSSLMSDRRIAVINHPFLAWLSGMERSIVYQNYGTDLFLSPVASRRFSVGCDRLGQIVIAVNGIDRKSFEAMKWIGASIAIDASKPGAEEEWDWLMLAADLNLSTPPQDGVEPEKDLRSVFSVWLPANLGLLARVIVKAKEVKNNNLLGPQKLRLISIPDNTMPEPVNYKADITSMNLVVTQGGQCVVPPSLLPANARPAWVPKPPVKTAARFKGKKSFNKGKR
jgi:hypothetical protein